jgi:phage tail-like protein
MPARPSRDPFGAFRFRVEVDGRTVGGFREVTGLAIELEVEDYREGGVNEHLHRLPKGVQHGRLTLRRGLTDSLVLFDWQAKAAQGELGRTGVHVYVLDETGQDAWSFHCRDAIPVKWAAPELKADGNLLAVETLELVHNGFSRG